MGGKGSGPVSTFNRQDADEIIARLSQGMPLTLICEDEWLPAYRTVYDWMKNDPVFAAEIAHARNVGWDKIAASTIAIADSPNAGVDANGNVFANDPQRDKLRVWTRLELLKRWDPKRYGESKEVRVSGAVAHVPVTSVDPIEAAKEYQRLISGGKSEE